MSKPDVFNYKEYEDAVKELKALRNENANLRIRCRIAEADRAQIVKKRGESSTTKCWDCANAVPERRNGRWFGCPRSEGLCEVPGWEVKVYKTIKVETNGAGVTRKTIVDHIQVLECPEFVPDEEVEI